ncbi:MAG: PH domain-containing protein [Patescibacteria group bacterium]|nr:PH domain-containing protein [Patescibacteria group bacterium]
MEELEFNGQKEDEKVILAIKQSIITFLPALTKILTLWLVVLLIYKFSFYVTWGYYNYLVTYGFFIALAWSLYILFIVWYIWANTIYLVTSLRIMSVEQKGWFSRIISEATLENILFISHKVEGPLQTMLNFGSIHIRASGVVEEEIVFRNINNPYDVQQKIVTSKKEITGKTIDIKDEDEDKDFWKPEKKKVLIR